MGDARETQPSLHTLVPQPENDDLEANYEAFDERNLSSTGSGVNSAVEGVFYADGGRLTGIRSAARYYGGSRFAPTPIGSGSSCSTTGSTATAQLNETMIETDAAGGIDKMLVYGLQNSGSVPLAAVPVVTKKFPELMISPAAPSAYDDPALRKNTLIDEVVKSQWGDDLAKLENAVANIRNHVKVLHRDRTASAEAMRDISNRVLGFVCTYMEPIPKLDVQRLFGCAEAKPQHGGRHYVFHGIIIRPDTADDDKDDEEKEVAFEVEGNGPATAQASNGEPEIDGVISPAGNSGNSQQQDRMMTAEEAALLHKVPTRKQVDALLEYFLLLQNWAKAAFSSPNGRLTPQRAARNTMILFQQEHSLRSSWLRGVIESVENIRGKWLMAVNSIDTGMKFQRIPCNQATWLVPDWLEELPPLAVRAVFPDAISTLYERKQVLKCGERYQTRMYLNIADETVMDPSATPERLFHRQLFDQVAVWYCLLRTKQCMRMNTVHLRFYGAAFYPPTQESRDLMREITSANDYDDDGLAMAVHLDDHLWEDGIEVTEF